MYRQDLFNTESLCIFSDSAFQRYSFDPYIDKTMTGVTVPAYIAYSDYIEIGKEFSIMHSTTTQQGELYAIFMAVASIVNYPGFKHYRIFSDSETSIKAIRDRIFNWVRDTNNGKIMLGDNGTISNQSYIMAIVRMIMINNIPIEFYHVKGHVNVNSKKDIDHAKMVFERNNGFEIGSTDPGLIYQLAIGNDSVDKYAVKKKNIYANDPAYGHKGMIQAVQFPYTPFDMQNYKMLVSGGLSYYDII